MMSPDRKLSQADADSPAGPPQARPGWIERHLPPRGFERAAFLILVALALALKVLAIYHYRCDSDETQHAHVTWGWVTGRLQYRDVFDNHMPLFQILLAPLMALLGQRADIIVLLRWAMLPLCLVCVWAIYRLTETLYSRRLAPWFALIAGVLWKFFYTSTEFRTDDLWAALWLLSLVVAVSGKFTLRRAFALGLMLGLAFAVSLKTVALLLALGTATAAAMSLAFVRGERPPLLGAIARLALILAGAAIPPAATALYFASRGAFWIMYYCVITHNFVPGMKRWGDSSLHFWYYPLSLPLVGAYAWLIFRQTPDTRLAIRRAIILLTPWCFLCLLLSYWPDITREDDLPYIPLTPLSFIPLFLLLAGARLRDDRWRRNLLTYGLPAVALCDCLITFRAHSITQDRLRVTTHSIADVLALTDSNDYVMDAKGDYVFRRRPYYWMFETISKARMRRHFIQDRLPQALENTGTKMCYLYAAHILPATTHFILSNYIPFDPASPSLGVAGKELGSPSADGTYAFDVAIPATYAVVSESGATAGELDGAPYLGPVPLNPGHHLFRRTSGGGRAAIFLDRAQAQGFTPLFDVSEKSLELAQTKKKKVKPAR
jgi:hypothetical protein